jgi:uncharacterized protein (TIGR03083 family)
MMEPLSPIDTSPLFAPLHDSLMATLRGLNTEQWNLPTIAGRWRIRDVAAHLLDGDLRKLSVYRDGHRLAPGAPIESTADLTRFLKDLNAQWIAVAQRFSPRAILDLLATTGPQITELMRSLPLHEPALFAVSWAGEQVSENWFDIGREYTERWHHQMQIREGAGLPLLLEAEWMRPLLDISVRALPPAFVRTRAAQGTTVSFEVAGESGGVWSLVSDGGSWHLFQGLGDLPSAIVRTDPDSAWRLLFHALSREEAAARVSVAGDARLAAPILDARAVMV